MPLFTLRQPSLRDEFSESIYRKSAGEERRDRPWSPFWERIRCHRTGGSTPTYCPETTTFCERNRHESRNGILRGSFCIPFCIPFR